MIVRNERATIERCLHSAAGVIDAAVICDTGSTDDTATLAREALAASGVPVSIHEHRWQDFGANRTAALHAARPFISSLGWPPDETYWLFLDADHELVIEPDFQVEAIAGHALSLRQCAGSLVYWNLRLARADLDWRAVGATHEYYTCGESVQPERCSGLWVRDHNDGGSRADKFQRDLDLLTTSLERTPDDPRTLFYLAQTYAALGDPIKAIVLYRKRIAAGGWPEEVFYSMLAIGRLFAASGELEPAAAALLEAQRLDPERAEPLYELARLHRIEGRLAEAAAFADRGRRIPFPSGRSLFVHRDVYDHRLDLELARAGAATPLHEAGFEACERLVLSRTTPPDGADAAREATLSYADVLKGARFLRLQPDIAPPYRPCNPSVLRTRGGYLVNCRTVNFEQRRLRYFCDDADRVFRSRNVIMRLARDFTVLDERPMVIDEPPLRQTAIQGLEDCRLFEVHRTRFVFCTTTDRHPSGHIHMSICRLQPDGRVAAHRPLVGRFDDRPQKNWLPFVDRRGNVRAIYQYDPLTVVRVSVDSGRYDVEAEVAHPWNAASWRGSAGPISIPGSNRLLILVHEAVSRDGPDGHRERVYLHRFVECDSGFSLTRVSRPFVFAHQGIEFSCGMTLGHDRANLVIGLGIEDGSAYLCQIPLACVEALLHDMNLRT